MSPRTPRQPMVECPHCGALNDPGRGSKYCFSCNMPLSQAELHRRLGGSEPLAIEGGPS